MGTRDLGRGTRRTFLGAVLAAVLLAAPAHAATLGTTTVGSRSAGLAINLKRVNAYTLTHQAVVSKMSVYVSPTGSTGTEDVEGVIYADNGAGAPGALTAQTYEDVFTSGFSAGWYDLRFQWPVLLSPGRYWLGLYTGGDPSVAAYYFDVTADTTARIGNTQTYAPLGASNPFGAIGWTDGSVMSLYATYTGPRTPGTATDFFAGLNYRAQPQSFAPGPDGNLWFTDQGVQPAIGRVITGTGQVTEFSSSSLTHPSGIAEGPDGHMWFGNGGQIGRITSSGAIDELAVSSSSAIQDVTLGPDGNIWFADSGNHAVGRITPSGAVKEFTTAAMASRGDAPDAITAGPGGNLWFADDDLIGRVTSAGTITLFRIGLPGGATSIAQGPDGNVWFTADHGYTSDQSFVGRMTPEGVVTAFPTGAGYNSTPGGIAPGPDGNLWFTDTGSPEGPCACFIERITPSGQITKWERNFVPGGIGPGADGSVWTGGFGIYSYAPVVERDGTGAPPAVVRRPTVTGSSHAVGTPQQCSSAVWATWAGQQPVAAKHPPPFGWLRDGHLIAGQTGSTYVPTSQDAGHVLSCRQSVIYPLLGVTVSATSAGVTIS